MVRLVAAYHDDLLVDTHLHLAKVCTQLLLTFVTAPEDSTVWLLFLVN